jgi:hypothetical protein
MYNIWTMIILILATMDQSVPKMAEKAKNFQVRNPGYPLSSTMSYILSDPKVMRNVHIKPRVGDGTGAFGRGGTI